MSEETLAKKYLRREWDKLTSREQKVINALEKRLLLSRNTPLDSDHKRTFGEQIADKVAAFGGSWTFIFIFVGILIVWVIVNSYFLVIGAFDPYPYILLNLFLSMTAALQAPVIMMSQNRAAARDRLDASHDYEINLKAELEIRGMHEKMDELREIKWVEMVEMQQQQIRLLERLLREQMKGQESK